MDKEKLENALIDYIDGLLSETEQAMVEHELATNPEARNIHEQLKVVLGTMEAYREFEPDKNARSEFQEFLDAEMTTVRRIRPAQRLVYRIAAAVALVITGAGIGYWISWQQEQKSQLMALKSEIRQTRQLVMDKLENDQSAGQRILGVQAAYAIESADQEIIDALIRVMNADPNANVRLSAIDALKHFHQEPGVRKALIRALSEETDPVVQIALIRLMIEMKEKEAIEPMRQITTDVNTLPAVRDEAYAGIFRLS